MGKLNIKKAKVAIASFLILGITGMTILKVQQIANKKRAKNRGQIS